MADNYDMNFIWPHTEPNDVVVTGTFDGWTSSVHLKRTAIGFEAKVPVPWNSKILYKFRVNGTWVTHEDQQTEVDPIGNVNNVAFTPEKPVAIEPAIPEANGTPAAKKDDVAPVELVESAIDEPAPVLEPVESEDAKEAVPPPVEKEDISALPVEPDVPISIQPIVDATTDTTTEAKPEVLTIEASAHEPALVTESGPTEPPVPISTPEVSSAVPETEAPPPPPKPSTPPPPATDAKLPGPVVPSKTNGTHARESTSASTASTTPKSKLAFPSSGTEDGSGSVRSKASHREKRTSFIQKLKNVFHRDHSPDGSDRKERKKRHSLAHPLSQSDK